MGKCTNCCRNLSSATKYAVTDLLANQRTFAIGLSTVLIVVAFVTLLQNAIVSSNVVFVRLSEQQVGELDILFVPDLTQLSLASRDSGQIPSFWINETFMRSALSGIPGLAGTCPRWTLQGVASNPADRNKNSTAIFLVLDSLRESTLNLGKTWTRRPLQSDEVYVSASLLRALGLVGGRGNKITLGIDLLKLTGSVANANLTGAVNSALDAALANLTVNSLFPNSSSTVDVASVLESLGLNVPAGTEVLGFPLNAFPVASIPSPVFQALVDVVVALVKQQLPTLLSPSVNVTILDGVEAPDGKWPSSLGNVVMLEKSGLPDLVRRLLPPNTNLLTALLPSLAAVGNLTNGLSSVEQLVQVLGAASSLSENTLDQYAFLVVAVLKDRSLYLSDESVISANFVSLTNAMYGRLGYNFTASPSTPVANALSGVLFVKLFLEQIFGSVMAILVILGMMLIYSLILGNVSDKTFEYGMLRALGFERASLVGLLFVNSLLFTLPGIGLGLLAAWLLWVPLSLALQTLTSSLADYGLSWQAVVLGLVLGLVMPFVANVGPIRRALSSTLRDALDMYHDVQSELKIKAVKLKSMGFSLAQILAAIILVCIGFLVYYLIPLAFTFGNFPLFLGILNVILLSMVLGLCLVASTVQPSFEKLVVWCMVWGKDRRFLSLIEKNMSAHRPRNSKTALMFTLSLGFIIFAGASFSLQAATIGDSISNFFGADINIYVTDWSSPLPETEFREILDKEMLRNGSVVLGYAFSTLDLWDSEYVTDLRMGNLAKSSFRRLSFWGLEQHHLNVTYQRFFDPTQCASDLNFDKVPRVLGHPDVVDSIYRNDGLRKLPIEANISLPPTIVSWPGERESKQEKIYENYIDVVFSEALRDASTVNIDTPLRVYVQFRDVNNRDVGFEYLAKGHCMCRKLPGFFLSSYRQTANGSPVFVSMPQFVEFVRQLNEVQAQAEKTATSKPFVNISLAPPKGNLWVRLTEGATLRESEAVIDLLRNVISDDRVVTVNVKGLVASTSTASTAMLVFFNVVALINTLLSFFMLWVSFDANVRFNSWEFGVLRSLGVSGSQLTRCYIYEAVAVVFCAVTLGTVVGILVSVTLTLQYGLFLELPFVLYFPVALFLSVFLISLAVAVLGAAIPARSFAKQPISSVIRGL